MSLTPQDPIDGSIKPGKREKAGARVVVLLLLGLVVLFGGAYAAAYFVAADKVPQGTTVAGVKIGGHPQGDAASILENGLAARAAAPIRARVGDTVRSLSPEDAGFSVDYEASVAEAGGRWSWSPKRLWDYFTGGKELDPVLYVDETAQTGLIDSLNKELGKAPVEGKVEFKGAEVKSRPGVIGEALDPEQVHAELAKVYLSDTVAELPLVPVEPEITADDVQAALDAFANPAVSEPVAITFDTATVKIAPEDYTPALSMAPVDGALVPQLDPAKLDEVLKTKVNAPNAPQPAQIVLVDGKPKVIPDKPGVLFDSEQVNAGFLELVAKPSGQRTLAVDAKTARADFTTEAARALKVKERVSTFTTYYPYAEYRNINIGRAAELINGTLLKPDEIFSLNDTVGERTAANGFTEGFIISDGIFKEDLGGGVSQMATTTFNAMFFAGLKDIEHKPHSFYIDRYPVGREATVAWGAVDLKFQNDTPYGVLISAHVTPSTPSSQGVVTVSMYSTKVWDITSSTGDRYNLTEPKTRTLTTEDCYPNEGYGGFDIDVKRYFRKPGSSTLEKTENFHTTYIPSDTVICKKPEPSPSPSSTG